MSQHPQPKSLGWVPGKGLEKSCAEQGACYKLHPQTFVSQGFQTLSLISSHTLKGSVVQLPPLGMFRPHHILLDVKSYLIYYRICIL